MLLIDFEKLCDSCLTLCNWLIIIHATFSEKKKTQNTKPKEKREKKNIYFFLLIEMIMIVNTSNKRIFGFLRLYLCATIMVRIHLL